MREGGSGVERGEGGEGESVREGGSGVERGEGGEGESVREGGSGVERGEGGIGERGGREWRERREWWDGRQRE